MRPDCPECGEPMGKPFTSCKCGWRAVPARRDGNPHRYGLKVGDHWVNKGCAWNDHGQSCGEYGPLSLCTNGEGPWYCRAHFADLMKWPLEFKRGPATDARPLRMALEKALPQRQPGEDVEELA